MEYKLNIIGGQLVGFQYVNYELEGMNISETQYFEGGQSVNEECSIQVFNPRILRSYFFDASQWGTIELARDAAELFATSGELNCVYHPVGKGASMSFNVLPNNEGALV